MYKLDRVISQILRILKEDTRGLTIGELASQTKVSRITASMALMKLEGAKLIITRKIGNCRLHYLSSKEVKGDQNLGKKEI
ncbi:winged helix-turn-helix transcriptional regulator [Candidatus Woesearchaeota archaeon]|nr:winged helix-turn-helix transcriptional regulator [Candidatus Woesearchaeota archaeon]